jgi:RHS repeat-associated protein
MTHYRHSSSIPVLCALALSGVISCGTEKEVEIAQPRKSDPTLSRIPSPSKALSLDSNWTPPEPTRSRTATRKDRVEHPTQFGVSAILVNPLPSDEELKAVPTFSEPLMPVPGVSAETETRDLASAIAAYQLGADFEEVAPLRQFVAAYPSSRWTPVLLLNLGRMSYETGRFREALRYWKEAWDLAKSGTDITSEQIANLAIAEYAKMNARVGRQAELDRIFAEVQNRRFMGDARVKLESALEGRWMMMQNPGVSFRCGPYALATIAPLLDPTAAARSSALLERIASPAQGFSLNEVLAMSNELGLRLQRAYREPGSALMLPSVVHWGVGHYGALVRELNGKYLLEDPTFGNQTWLSQRAIDQEASGYFLVPEGPLPAGWRPATEEEGAAIFGKGHSGTSDPGETGPNDPQTPDQCGGNIAMATYRFHILLASLSVSDTPVGYDTAVGPEVRVRVTYNQREAEQPATFTFTNFSPQWVSNWVSYLEDNPSSPGADVKLRIRGGGGEVHKNFNSTTQSYGLDSQSASVLYKLSANTYKKQYSDGSVEYYEQYIGTTGTARKVFLSRVVDPQGNQVSIEYDSTYPARIHRIIDATGLPSTFYYDYPGQTYLVTSIEDPYGRLASFTYSSVGGVLRLQSIEDPVGIISSFGYNSQGEMETLTTPYGTTSFALSPLKIGASADLIRFIQATDPYGEKERIEYNLSAAQTGLPSTLEQPRPDSNLVSYYTADNTDRNSFYWDKLQMKMAPGDYTKAHRYHWLQGSTLDSAVSILESEVPPLEGRIFYNYPGQTQANIQGTLAQPSVVGRVIQNAAGQYQTQAHRYEYNSLGKRTRAIDPIGRETVTEYTSNGIDVSLVKQKTGESGGTPTWGTLVSYTYDLNYPPHRPKIMTDGSGQSTSYTYSSTTGQLLTVTNPKNQVTTYGYLSNPSLPGYRRLASISGDVAGGDKSFTFDDQDRVRTISTIDGSTLTFDYDDLNRVRIVTYEDDSFEQFEYADHSLVAARDRAGRWTRYQHNALRQRVATRSPSGRLTQEQWCRCGRIRRLVDGAGNVTEWQRDVEGRVVRKLYADGSQQDFAFDFSGRLVSETDPLNRSKLFEYTLDDRVSKIDYSDSATADVTYAYDSRLPRITSRVDGRGTTAFTYKSLDSSTLGAGQVALVNGPLSDDTLKHTYNELGRLKRLEIVDDITTSTASWVEEYTFDSRGRVTAAENNLGLFEFAFVGQSSRVDHINYPNSMLVTFDYFDGAADRRLKQIRNLSAPTSPPLRDTISQFDYTYTQDGSINTWSIQQGTAAATVWTFDYDQDRRLTDAVRRDQLSQVLDEYHYSYDRAGNRIQVATGTTSLKNLTTNNLNELRSERAFGPTIFAGSVNEPASVTVNGRAVKFVSSNGQAPYRFESPVELEQGTNTITIVATDGNSNTRTDSYLLTSTGTTTLFEFDSAGNIRYEREPNAAVRREYQWDQSNRLRRIIEGADEIAFDYDGEHMRVGVRESQSGVEIRSDSFVWCGSRICQKRQGTTLTRNYFQNGFEEPSGDFFYTRDYLGSVFEVVGSDGATIESRVSYSPWGEEGYLQSAGALSDFGYTGHYVERSRGILLAPYRGYDPKLGRWLNRDPIAETAGPNLYAYVENAPTGKTDMSGLLTDSYTTCVRQFGPQACGGPIPGPVPRPPWLPLLCFIYPSMCDPGGERPPGEDPECDDTGGGEDDDDDDEEEDDDDEPPGICQLKRDPGWTQNGICVYNCPGGRRCYIASWNCEARVLTTNPFLRCD